jgi:hypothetical protein
LVCDADYVFPGEVEAEVVSLAESVESFVKVVETVVPGFISTVESVLKSLDNVIEL